MPEPVATVDGSLVVTVAEPGVPGSRCCALLRWIDGRFVNRRLTPVHLARMGATMGRSRRTRSSGRRRPDSPPAPRHADRRGQAREPGRSVGPGSGDDPRPVDGDRAVALVEELLSPSEGAVAARAIAAAREATSALAGRPGSSGLIHGDLHQENTLFTVDGAAAAIDFDDCGWGFYLYDIAVPLSELTERRRFLAMRGAFLEAYARRR